MTPPRYVVLVWFYDHWSVSTTPDNFEAAEADAVKASRLMPVKVVDTQQNLCFSYS